MGKPSALGAISGSVAGLATITQASGFVEPFPAVLIGLMGGVICFTMVAVVKSKFGYDDSLDAFGVHGIGGIIGCTMTGVFGTNLINDGLKLANGQSAPIGWVDGNAKQIVNQMEGAAIAIFVAVVGSLVALKIADMVSGLKMSEAEQADGMDVVIHGEEGYSLDS